MNAVRVSKADGTMVPPRKPLVGMYGGWGQTGADAITAFETANSVTVPLGHEFGDSSRWDWFREGTQFDVWSAWCSAKAGRRFSWSVPLLTVNGDTDMSAPDGKTISQKYVTLATGGYDAHFDQAGWAIRNQPALYANGPVIVRLGWEFNGNSRAWSIPPNDATTLANYKTGFARAVAALRAGASVNPDGSPRVLIEWCPNTQLDYTQRTFDDLMPAPSSFDIVGIGAYDYYWPATAATDAQRWNWLVNGESGTNGLANQVQLARKYNKHLAHTEWGLWPTNNSGGGGDHPAWVRRLARWHRTHGYSYEIYNNVFASTEHRLDQYPSAKAIYVADRQAGSVWMPDAMT